ncbi:MAG: VWA domain-containing protein [Chloroflexota bacterium]|nr:VWA domain-containing protein [Chloroflexota bacterium]NOG64522.1 VWA domain-containing protein [Chloroflexota bacterium]GIK66070.1 MAG: VWA domain-containing protein [Chloroflexota bacterium]
MSITNPSALFLLLLIPIFIRIGWPRLAYRRRRDTLALGIRILLVLLIVLGMAGVEIRRAADKLAVVFLVDVSDSMDAAAQKSALDFVRDSIAEMNQNDQAAVVLFGANAQVEHPMDELVNLSPQPGSLPTTVTLNTDLAEAIRLGIALFPADTAKRMVILSDGIETVGDAEQAAQLAEATGIQIDYVAFARQRAPEILVSNVRAPSQVSQDEPFDLIVTIESETDTRAELRVLSGGVVIYNTEVDLEAGTKRYSIGPIQSPRTGFVDFRVQIEPLSVDGFYKNNELSAFTRITGQPRILLVASDPAELQYLQPALVGTGFEIDTITPDDLPMGLAALSQYSSIVMANVSATSLLPDQMELLKIYVRDLGGGLVVIGGPNSYGVGGYFETPLEEVLPVDMRIRDQTRIPQLTMLFVIDRSGSMEIAGPSGVSNLELAKEAIIRSFNFLNDYDRAGVVSFDSQAFWVLDIQEMGDAAHRQVMADEVGRLRPGGGTDIFGGLTAASRILPDDPSTLKHIILLTDGGASEIGITELVGRMFDNYDITTSVIAVGTDYARWLERLPPRGGGNFHVTTTIENIPAIFAAETVLATRSYIFEDPFFPTLTARSPIMDGITSTPQLQGYIATTEKDTATVVLRGPEEDPLLAQWQYGLGRSVAFTSDATARWGRDWVNWEQYTRFWNQVVRWTITEGTNSQLEAYVEQRGEQAVLVVDARDDLGNYLNDLELDANIVTPDRTTINTELQQVAPGRYEAVFTPNTEGTYILTVAGSTREGAPIEATVAQSTGWVLSYSPEYSLAEPDELFLEKISNGISLAGNPAAAFLHNLDHEEAARSLWPFFLGAAAFLLIGDIAVRRLVINRSDVERAREGLRHRFGMNQRAYQETETAGVMVGLKHAKQRASEKEQPAQEERQERPPVGAPVVATPAATASALAKRKIATPPTTASGQTPTAATPPISSSVPKAAVPNSTKAAPTATVAPPPPKPQPPKPQPTPAKASGEHSASQLLKKKRSGDE